MKFNNNNSKMMINNYNKKNKILKLIKNHQKVISKLCLSKQTFFNKCIKQVEININLKNTGNLDFNGLLK